jgi:hypothetical protein
MTTALDSEPDENSGNALPGSTQERAGAMSRFRFPGERIESATRIKNLSQNLREKNGEKSTGKDKS